MKNAIENAIEGGWKPKHWMEGKISFEFEDLYLILKSKFNISRLAHTEIREDPDFWQSYCRGDRIKGEELALGLVKHLFRNGKKGSKNRHLTRPRAEPNSSINHLNCRSKVVDNNVSMLREILWID